MKRQFNGASRLTHIALHVEDIEKSVAFYKSWCGMNEVSRRNGDDGAASVVWMACPDQQDDFVIVLMSGAANDQVLTTKEKMRHLGFAVATRKDVRELADKARKAGILHWDYQEHEEPVGTLCSIRDPDGHIVEFSYGQPLGPDLKNSVNDNNAESKPHRAAKPGR